MDGGLGLCVVLLGLNHDFGAFFHDEVQKDHADGDYHEHPRINDRDQDHDSARMEEALESY